MVGGDLIRGSFYGDDLNSSIRNHIVLVSFVTSKKINLVEILLVQKY
jgi:hypothetical protein